MALWDKEHLINMIDGKLQRGRQRKRPRDEVLDQLGQSDSVESKGEEDSE